MDETTARDIRTQIDQPSQPELRTLQQTAIDNVEGVLSQAGFPTQEEVCRRLSYTFYYDWVTDDPEYVLLVQDPGNLHKRHLSELRPHNPLAGDCSAREQIAVYRAFGRSWLAERNPEFSEAFFETLERHDFISLPDGWRSYVESGAFYRDCYLGDVVKYRVDGFGVSEERVSYHALLEQELQALDPELVFTFGSNAWSTIRRHTDLDVVGASGADPERMLDIHGTLHRISTPIETHVLPLAHMSGQVWWRFPPEEYVERLESALQAFQQRV